MILKEIIKDYTPFLLKTGYLITRDKTKAEEIVEQTFSKYALENHTILNKSKIKSKLLEHLVKSLQVYFKSWYYQKLRLKQIFDTNEQYNHAAHHENGAYAILRLPINLREVATLYFYCELTTAEISRLLGVAQGTVQQRILKAQNLIKIPIFEEEVGVLSEYIDRYLMEWNERAQKIEQKLLDTVEAIEQLPAKKNYKKVYISISVMASAVIVLVISQLFLKEKSQPIQQIVGEFEQVEATEIEEFFPGSSREGNVLVPPERSLEIAKYFEYYMESIFYSEVESELNGKEKIYYNYGTQYALEKMNYVFDYERIKHYQERAALTHRANKENQDYEAFMQLLFDRYRITEEDVISYYLLPQELSGFFEEVYVNKYSETTNESMHEMVEEYYKIINYDNEAAYTAVQTKLATLDNQYEKLKDYSQLPFKINNDTIEYALNEEGEIIILNPSSFYRSLTGVEDHYYFYDLEYQFNRSINRLSIADYITFLEEKYEETKNQDLINFIEMYKILNRSIKLN